MIGIVNGEDSYKLLKLLKHDSRPLRDVLADFDAAFPRSLRFPLCTSLYLILQVKPPPLLLLLLLIASFSPLRRPARAARAGRPAAPSFCWGRG